MSVTQPLPKLSQASASTPRAPSMVHIAISKAPVSEAGTMAHEIVGRQAEQRLGLVDGELQARLAVLGAMRAAEEGVVEGFEGSSRGAWRRGRRRNERMPGAGRASWRSSCAYPSR